MDKYRSLGQGIMTSSLTRICSPTIDKRVNINSIKIFNSSTSTTTVSVWANVKGFRFPLVPPDFDFIGEYSAELVDNPPLGLEYGDFIEARAGLNGVILFNINGEEGTI